MDRVDHFKVQGRDDDSLRTRLITVIGDVFRRERVRVSHRNRARPHATEQLFMPCGFINLADRVLAIYLPQVQSLKR